jgi:dipeptidyl-peptidase-4
VLAEGGKRLFNYTEAFSGQFSAKRTTFSWTSADVDGTYVSPSSDKSLIFKNIVTGTNETFVDASKLGVDYYDYWIQPNRENVLFASNYKKVYRHSYLADYYIFNRASGTKQPLVKDQKQDIQYAAWSPVGDTIAYVRANDLYIWRNGTSTRITKDGGENVFNGIPDWVYEEEVFGDRYTLWFSPDGEYLAFLRFNETGVPTYTVPYYMNGTTTAPKYPEELKIRYPKVGETNPTVTFNLLSLTDSSSGVQEVPITAYTPEDLIIGEVSWVTSNHSSVIFRAFNRVQDKSTHILVSIPSLTTTAIRTRDGTDGWLDNTLSIHYVGSISNSTEKYYLDLSDHTGWTHLYLYPLSGGDPKPLTSGKWEVTDLLAVDTARGLAYFLSTEHHSTERHLYSVSLLTGQRRALVPTTPGYYTASFSASNGFYVLNYNGPDIPWQALYSANGTQLAVINDNSALREKLAGYNLPQTRYSELKIGNYSLNVREILPAGFNKNKKYPVLFDPYGGPGAQQVSKAWQTPGWRTYISSDPELEYIIVTVDGRGTGYQGRAFRSLVTRQLGKLEAEDQVLAAREWGRKAYVDKRHMVIWGWSFGGYLTGKVVERNDGVFSVGIITAPVSDWRFYDSVYTERYMKLDTEQGNRKGYEESRIGNAGGFKEVKGGVLVQHGSGDDNVHFQRRFSFPWRSW